MDTCITVIRSRLWPIDRPENTESLRASIIGLQITAIVVVWFLLIMHVKIKIVTTGLYEIRQLLVGFVDCTIQE